MAGGGSTQKMAVSYTEISRETRGMVSTTVPLSQTTEIDTVGQELVTKYDAKSAKGHHTVALYDKDGTKVDEISVAMAGEPIVKVEFTLVAGASSAKASGYPTANTIRWEVGETDTKFDGGRIEYSAAGKISTLQATGTSDRLGTPKLRYQEDVDGNGTLDMSTRLIHNGLIII